MLVGVGAGALADTSYRLIDTQLVAQQGTQLDVEGLKTWGRALWRNLVALLILGLLGIWLVPAPLNVTGGKILQAPWRMALNGLIFFVEGWFVALIGLSLIVALAIFFFIMSLPNLGVTLGVLGLAGLGTGIAVFVLSIAYISKVIVAFLIGGLLLKRFAPRLAQSNLWQLLLGVLLYALLASIPYLGWVISIVATFVGLGALWALIFPLNRQKNTVESLPILEPAE